MKKKTAHINVTPAMQADYEVVRLAAIRHGLDGAFSEVVRLALRQTRKRLEAGMPLIDASEPVRDHGLKAKTWTQAEIDLLGAAPDREVAARLGRTETAVRGKRNTLRIKLRKPV